MYRGVEARESLVDRNYLFLTDLFDLRGRGSREPRGSKFFRLRNRHSSRCRGSREPRGSKYEYSTTFQLFLVSRLARASWIEIFNACCLRSCFLSRLARASWIEIFRLGPIPLVCSSRLARASWIEIFLRPRRAGMTIGRGSREPRGSKYPEPPQYSRRGFVEARESLVDRNGKNWVNFHATLCRGSREPRGSKSEKVIPVAPFGKSRLARASWIEICDNSKAFTSEIRSRLARASWIEIFLAASNFAVSFVEARESLVDRNIKFFVEIFTHLSRGSREPRGSKYAVSA